MTWVTHSEIATNDEAGGLDPQRSLERNADLAIHECFITVPDLVAKMGSSPESALRVGTQVHTAPEAFGKVMSVVRPRMAVAHHFFKDFDTTGVAGESRAAQAAQGRRQAVALEGSGRR